MMFDFIKTLIGGGAAGAASIGMGVKYLRSEIGKAGCDPDVLPVLLYRELAEHALKYSKSMSEVSQSEKAVTYFVQHLDYITDALCCVLNNTPVEADISVIEILRRYRLKFDVASR